MLIVVGYAFDFIWEAGFVWMCYEVMILDLEEPGGSFFLL